MVLRARTLEEHVKAILSVENRYFTKRALGLDREPNHEELIDHYKRYNIIATVEVNMTEPAKDDVPFSHA